MTETVPLVVTEFRIGDLSPYHRNPRRGNVKAIAASLKKRGQYRPIVVNVGSKTGRKNEILAGNHTWAAAKSLGWKTIQATTVDLDDDGAAQVVLADNRLADLGTYDEDDLAALLASVSADSYESLGFSDADVADLLASSAEPVSLTDPDDAPALPEDVETITQVGQVWHLGPNRLVVGSSTDLDLVSSAFGDEKASCIWTDPPYGVNYVGGTSDALRIKNDDPDTAVAVTRDALTVAAAVCRPGAPVYVAHGDALRTQFQSAMEAAGIRWRETLIWVKDRFVLGHMDYQAKHEPILHGEVPAEGEDLLEKDWSPVGYGFLPGGEGRLGRGGEHWFGDNKQTTVFEVKRPSRNAEHPTMKPVELIEGMISNSCPPGGIVYDPFAGSGSTLIAAHRQRMRAVVVELDCRYADVICARWQAHTGVVPELDGEPVDFRGLTDER